jgi:hypothetical protein
VLLEYSPGFCSALSSEFEAHFNYRIATCSTEDVLLVFYGSSSSQEEQSRNSSSSSRAGPTEEGSDNESDESREAFGACVVDRASQRSNWGCESH